MKTKIRKILKLISSKTFLGALAFSFSLWLYINLNTEFVSFVKIPLYIVLPENRAIEMELPEYVSVEVRGTGWSIFNLSYLNTSAQCNMDLTGEIINDSVYAISRTDFIKNLSDMGNVQAIDVVPNSFNLKTGKIGEYAVVVEPDITIIPSDGYTVVGDIVVRPNLINIKGNDRKIRGFTKWKTERLEFEEVSDDINVNVSLSDTLSNIIELSTGEVNISADIQKLTEIRVKDVRLKFNGAALPDEHKITPLFFDVTIRAGIDEIENFNSEEIELYVNTIDVVNDSTGIIRPILTLPKRVKSLGIYPPYLKHTITQNKTVLAKD